MLSRSQPVLVDNYRLRIGLDRCKPLPTVFQSVISGFWSVTTDSKPLATGFASVRSVFLSVSTVFLSVFIVFASLATDAESLSTVFQSIISGFWSVTTDSKPLATGFASVRSGNRSLLIISLSFCSQRPASDRISSFKIQSFADVWRNTNFKMSQTFERFFKIKLQTKVQTF